jgi:hypothetical protein
MVSNEGRKSSAMGLTEIADLIGHECLAYVAATTVAEIAERLGGRFLDGPREASLASLQKILSSPVVTEPVDFDSRRLAATSVLTAWEDGAEATLATLLRRLAGGTMPAISEPEPIAEALCFLARESYAAVLIPGSPDRGVFAMNGAFRSPWNTKLQEAVLADSKLGKLFKGPVDGVSSSFRLWSSAGHGDGGMQVALLGSRLLGTPSAMARARSIGIEDFIGLARQAVSDMRTLLAGEPLMVPAVQGLDGLVLPAGVEVRTRWGILRPLSKGEEDLIYPDFRGSGNAVIETDYEVCLSIESVEDASEMPEFPDQLARRREKADAQLEEATRMVALAVLLAKDLPMPAHIGHRYTLIAEPFSWSPGLWGRGPMPQMSIPAELSREDIKEVERWVARIEQNHHESMSVAVSRTISAHERLDATDAFVDALIAWDAVFGSRSGDSVVFRVATGFALLLGEDEEGRRKLKKRAQDLYRLRSAVVHGSVPRLEWSVAHEHRQEAVEMLLAALRHLYRDAPELLAGSDRTNDLLMLRGLG